jgi:hypothetical protein
MRKRIYIAGKSGDSWYQLPAYTRQGYKAKLAKMYGSRCYPRYSITCANSKGEINPQFGCGKYFPLALLTVDHIVPISKGGPVFDLGNMQLLCWQCHQKKTTENDMIDV